jgi:hypothetical protein
VGAVGEVTIESALLGVDTKDVHVLTTGAGGVGQKLGVGDEQPIPKGCPEL